MKEETPRSLARDSRTGIARRGCGTVKAGVEGLRIPALCQEIESRVVPREKVWSMPRALIPVTWERVSQNSDK